MTDQVTATLVESPEVSTGKLTSPKRRATRKRRGGPVLWYWATFVLCAGVSFAAGFWFTYSYLSQVGVHDLTSALVPTAAPSLAPETNHANTNEGKRPLPYATPQDLFAAEPSPTPWQPEWQPTGPPPSPTPMIPAIVTDTAPPATEPTEEPTPEPTPEDIYRVQVGSYDSRESAEAMVQELLAAGIQAVVVSDQTKYHAQVGAFSSKERALAVADEVNVKGYSVTIRH
ncbi:MAG: SPOR domain-containing protein [Cyanobacteria bacterium NC_groundwater_1444_Ag_S-0.65um_54_12]|nr:SPOR domain-containing protein [Cyanobacteria bacterium NC_groundwater_1444_Ag_S-0.65um_54_12]